MSGKIYLPKGAAALLAQTDNHMALTTTTQSHILHLVNSYWKQHAQDQAFLELIQGKEPGHRMADYVDDKTTSLLKVNLDIRYEGDHNGSIKKRSMGDVWVHSQGIFNPVNIKSGLQGMKGQPNLVSMQKLLDYLCNRWIDSYYLLIVKFELRNRLSPDVYLVDLLDWTDFVTYDAGPGQIMLREQDFYDAIASHRMPQPRTILQKIETLFRLFESQVQQMIANRQRRVERQSTRLASFGRTKFVVDQSQMRFVP